jgi:hypothetical protein
VSGFKAPVEALFRLANTPFEAAPFRAACERFGTFDASSSDADLWYFSVGGPSLIVGLGDAGVVGFAVLSICWWETFHPAQHTNHDSWEVERAAFDRLYLHELEAAGAVLGSPYLLGQDKEANGHRWAVWRGQTGLLVLQQSAYDPQLGLDVNYWLHPWQGGDPRPGGPFIDWLFASLHESGLERTDNLPEPGGAAGRGRAGNAAR